MGRAKRQACKVIMGDGCTVEADGQILTLVEADGTRKGISRAALGKRYRPTNDEGRPLWAALDAMGVEAPTVSGKGGTPPSNAERIAKTGKKPLGVRCAPSTFESLAALHDESGRSQGDVLDYLLDVLVAVAKARGCTTGEVIESLDAEASGQSTADESNS